MVVGAGVFGSWTALRLRESGRSVALVEAWGPGNPRSSSGGASRVIRMGYGADEIYTRWALRSLIAWKELFARAQCRELFQPTGVLWTASPGHPHAEGTLSTFRKLGIRHEVLAMDDLRRRYSALRFERDAVGIFEPDCGALLANRAVGAVTREAVNAGVESLGGRIASPNEQRRLESIVTDRGRRIAADTFIFACGPWLPRLFPQAIGERIRVTRQTVFYYDAPEIGMPVWIDFSDPRGPYVIPPMDGKGFKLALDRHGPRFNPDQRKRSVPVSDTQEARAVLAERFPALADARVLECEVCQYESTSTGDFLIDRHPGIPNVWLVGGGSGHGFKHGPAVGEYVVSLLNGGPSEERFSWRAKTTEHRRSVY